MLKTSAKSGTVGKGAAGNLGGMSGENSSTVLARRMEENGSCQWQWSCSGLLSFLSIVV